MAGFIEIRQNVMLEALHLCWEKEILWLLNQMQVMEIELAFEKLEVVGFGLSQTLILL